MFVAIVDQLHYAPTSTPYYISPVQRSSVNCVPIFYLGFRFVSWFYPVIMQVVLKNDFI
jgi:hypothetical protein